MWILVGHISSQKESQPKNPYLSRKRYITWWYIVGFVPEEFQSIYTVLWMRINVLRASHLLLGILSREKRFDHWSHPWCIRPRKLFLHLSSHAYC